MVRCHCPLDTKFEIRAWRSGIYECNIYHGQSQSFLSLKGYAYDLRDTLTGGTRLQILPNA